MKFSKPQLEALKNPNKRPPVGVHNAAHYHSAWHRTRTSLVKKGLLSLKYDSACGWPWNYSLTKSGRVALAVENSTWPLRNRSQS